MSLKKQLTDTMRGLGQQEMANYLEGKEIAKKDYAKVWVILKVFIAVEWHTTPLPITLHTLMDRCKNKCSDAEIQSATALLSKELQQLIKEPVKNAPGTSRKSK